VLAERLQDLGYRTAAFVGNPVLRPAKGYDRGFDTYRMFDGKRGEGVRTINEAFFAWAEGNWDRPTFVWIHYMDPHGPYTPPAELLAPFLEDPLAAGDERVPLEPATVHDGNPNKVLGGVPAYQRIDDEDRAAVYVARYDAEIRHVDATFGELIAFLEGRGLYDGSAILFTSDHGESLGEHDYWFEHGWFAHEPGLRVPLIVKRPRQTTGEVVDRQVSLLDLLPTVLRLADAPVLPDVVGVDLLGTIGDRGPALIENSDRYPVKYHGVRTSDWKYLIRADGVEELYDLRADPGETTNLAGDEPGRVAELRAAYESLLQRAHKSAVEQAEGEPDDAATLERLKALGYLD
jgi:arylsulfatase A-like enzyme